MPADVIDTSRNGAGSNGEWCNPSGRALGPEPQAGTAGSLDAYLWIKPPGESDGECGGGPPAGEFWTERALELAANAGW
ncbi:glycoside hydrolase family 6 protein [Aeromicrobium sp. UC242_57]|uniref:glycoside hydrolase family 6 protein n=1 Tax=Aeromicrobium sp. UC242_57 TaxID=3374624 RepID=UPI0037904B3F